MPRIRIKDIIDFKTDSAKVPNDEILPILSYLKIEFKDNFCTITKNGLFSFVKKNIPCESTINDGVYLVNENKLVSIAEGSTSDFIELNRSASGDKIRLITGKGKAIIHTDNIDLFPKNDEPTNEWAPLYIEFLTSLQAAANFIEIESEKTQPATCNIFCKGNTLVACNGAIAFYKQLVNNLPELIIRKEVANAITGFPGAEYSFNSSYNFFRSGALMYGFIKSDAPYFDLTQFGRIESEMPSFSLIKDDLIRFNNICIANSKNKLITSRFNCKSATELELVFIDPDSGLDELLFSLEVQNASGSFKYNPSVMNELLRSVPSTICYFYPAKNKYHITDEKRSFVSLIMGVV